MKTPGILLLVVGCIFGIYAYQLETTVTTESKDFGYGISVPSMTVNNLGLMEERRNKLMIAGLMILVGVIVTAFGEVQQKEDEKKKTDSDTVKCPFCAELIKKEAVICRYCNKEQPVKHKVETAVNVASPAELMEKYGITQLGDKFHYGEFRYDRLNDAVNYAKLVTTNAVD